MFQRRSGVRRHRRGGRGDRARGARRTVAVGARCRRRAARYGPRGVTRTRGHGVAGAARLSLRFCVESDENVVTTHSQRHLRRSRRQSWLLMRSPTNSSSRGSGEVKRSTSSPPSQRSSAIVRPSRVRATTCQ
ncbi:hypothetical protein MSMEG_2126 [Mycolicibacterium smegmatis MC2 155]|uniref:Uncharacterized protein n=1 Tax=Mycolicibacterium smegmatis (strain ATCC 700084 / mc(2)155) TaxID=246196 RepID=A0QU96_MYCS2|nr:hypothetical protein MSMEG_2126 [Mycolicibacterium smegmatis MC2 155]